MTGADADAVREALTKDGVCLICGSGVLDGEHLRDEPCALVAVLAEANHFSHPVMSPHDCIRRAQTAEARLARALDAIRIARPYVEQDWGTGYWQQELEAAQTLIDEVLSGEDT